METSGAHAPLSLADVGYFLAAVDGGSLLAGARRVRVTAGAMTKSLQRLEASLGVRLMSRTTRGARLTSEGERMIPPLRALLDQADRVRLEAAGEGGTIAGELRILAMEVFSPLLLPRALASLVRQHPIVPKTYESIPERMIELVATGRADVAFTIGTSTSIAVRAVRLGTSPGVLVCGPRHPLRRKRSVRPADLRQYPSVVPRFWGAEHLPSLDQFPEATWPRSVGATIELLRMGVALVEEDVYLGYFPEIAIRKELAARSIVRLPSPEAPPFELTAMLPLGPGRPSAEALVAEVAGLIQTTNRTRSARARA